MFQQKKSVFIPEFIPDKKCYIYPAAIGGGVYNILELGEIQY